MAYAQVAGRMRRRRSVIVYRYGIAVGSVLTIIGAAITWLSFAGLLHFALPGLVTVVVGALVVLAGTAAALLTAALAGQDVCDGEDGETVPIDKHFRPDGRTYYRCRGHSPPHCYDKEEMPIPCP